MLHIHHYMATHSPGVRVYNCDTCVCVCVGGGGGGGGGMHVWRRGRGEEVKNMTYLQML